MKIAIVTTNDFYSKIAMSDLILSNRISYYVKANVPTRYKLKMFFKGLVKSPLYVTYMIGEMLYLSLHQKKLLKGIATIDRFDMKVSNINDIALTNELKKQKIDMVLFIRPLLIVKKSFLESFPESYNIHNTALPKYRGLGGIFQTMRHGEKILGITVHKMTSKLDAGDIAIQKMIEIPNGASLLGLTINSYFEANKVLAEFVDKCSQDDVKLKPQDESVASIFSWPKIGDFLEFYRCGFMLFRKIQY
ncbi:MAG: formyltransferase family protein [Campylobacterales bacterium]